jgi:oligopeptide/dipeptide ABC transporter ATP-binding protein
MMDQPVNHYDKIPFNAADLANRPNATAVLEARGLAKHFHVSGKLLKLAKRSVVQAVKGVDFTLQKQETLSIVGESGCGKTTTARLLLDLEKPTAGSIFFHGTPLSELTKREDYARYRLGVQAVFQDSTGALSPRRRIRKIIAEPLIVAGMSNRGSLDEEVRSLLQKVGLDPSVADYFPHELSGGMRQRVAIAQALATNPSVIILDEPVSALDVSIRAQILNLLKDVQDRHEVSYIVIAHDLATVRYLSHSVAAMYLGSVVEQAPVETFFTQATHPYTLALLSAAIPITAGHAQERIVLSGDLPSPASPPPGCAFHKRCWLNKNLSSPSICSTERPSVRTVREGHQVACHFAEESSRSSIRQEILAQVTPVGNGVATSGRNVGGVL